MIRGLTIGVIAVVRLGSNSAMGQGGFFRGDSVHALSRRTSIFIFPHHCRSSQITRPWRCLLALLCLLPVLAAFLAAGEPQWLEVRSEHFSVVTDAGEKTGRHVACLFEQVRTAFGVLFVRDRINEPVQLQIIAFRNASELRQYSPIFRVGSLGSPDFSSQVRTGTSSSLTPARKTIGRWSSTSMPTFC